MAKKTIKKTKKPVTRATKPVAKKTAVRRPVAKKHVKKTVRVASKPVANSVCAAPMMKQGCGCGCCCHHGHRFIGLCTKVIILCMVFLLGAASAPWLMRSAQKSMMRHVQFDNNDCVVLETVKCPKLLERLATADDNADGCISRQEFKAALADMHEKPIPEPMPADGFIE